MGMWYWTAGMGIWWKDNLFSLNLNFLISFVFLGDGLFLWQPSFLFLCTNYSGKNDFKSNTTLLIKVWCTLMKWYLIKYLIKTISQANCFFNWAQSNIRQNDSTYITGDGNMFSLVPKAASEEVAFPILFCLETIFYPSSTNLYAGFLQLLKDFFTCCF